MLYDAYGPEGAFFPSWFTTRWTSFAWSILFTSLAIAVVTLIAGKQTGAALGKTKDTGWLLKSRDELPPLREHPFERDVPEWLQPLPWAIVSVAVSCYVVFRLFW